jgi:D-3-phosphoglycerate dehydrogenase / 2-oxoglutarate reductase
MKIAILDDYQNAVPGLDCYKILDGHEVKVFNTSARGVGQLAVRLAPYDALVLIRERTHFPAALLNRLPNLKLISQTGKVSGHVDVAAATARGIAIAEGVGSPLAPAELTWALIMAASRKIVPYANNLREGAWQMASVNPRLNGLGRVLHGRTLGLWSYGKIGKLVAGYGRAFGMNVVVWGSETSRAQAVADGFTAAASRAALFADADVLSLHLRLADATRGIVTAEDLARMKPDALFVNTSRAELVAEGALEDALRRGYPGGAAVDVFTSEPLAPDAPLLKIPTVLATPHLGYVERDSYEMYFRAAFDNIVRFAAGEPVNILNPEALKP